MKIFLLFLASILFSLILYFKNFNIYLFTLRGLWFFILINVIFNPVIQINIKSKFKNIVLFDITETMKYGGKIREAEDFLKNVKGKYTLFYLKDGGEREIIERMKEEKISRILLISDGYLGKEMKNFLENSGIPVDVFTFPEKEFEENLRIKVPSFVVEGEEFLIKISFLSKKEGKGEIEIKGEGIKKREKVILKKGINHFNFKHVFEKAGKKKIFISFKNENKLTKREYEIDVIRKRPRIAILSEKPLPLVKILRDFITRNVREDIEIFVRLSKDVLKKINKRVENAKIPEECDWLIVISPDFLINYEKIISAGKIFYFYEDMPSEKISGKGVVIGKNFEIEIPSTCFKIYIKEKEGEKLLELWIKDKKFVVMSEKGNKTNFFLANLFEILFPLDEKIRDSILKYIFETSKLKNPEIVFYKIPEEIKENKNFCIKAYVLTPLLKPAYDVDVFLKINDKAYPMTYEGEGIFSSPPLQFPRGEYKFEIVAKREGFFKSSTGTLRVNSFEIERGVDREYLSFIAEKSDGKEVTGEYRFPEVSFHKEKYTLDLRKNLSSYILIALIFSLEIFLRKKTGFL